MKIPQILLVLAIGILAGCEDSTPSKAPVSPATPPANATAQNALPPPPPPPPPATSETANPTTPPTTVPDKKVAETPPPGMIAEKADVGSGDKGRGYGDGVITTPIATYFAARERIEFTIQIPEFIRAYKFEHDMKGPKSNEEFMEKIIKKNHIELPTLPPDHKYWYDASKEELQVLRPK
jgi:hypothetical protein